MSQETHTSLDLSRSDLTNGNNTISNQTTGSSTDIELDESADMNRDLEMNRPEDNDSNDSNNDEATTPQDGLLPQQFRDRAARQIDNIGRHFNILDRVFRRRPDGESALNGIASNMYVDEICIEGLPVGNAANLFWNIIVSTSFQFVGFLITYILHTSHAAKQGSRFGLGLTFIGYAYSMIPNNVTSKIGKYKAIDRYHLSDPNSFDDLDIDSDSVTQDEFESSLNHGFEEEKQNLPTLAIFIGLLGAFITVKSFVDYIKVKRMERKYMSQDRY
ncbi:hypothetical protein C6P45_001777 [Maudiozyma exigua]|uniref:Uncharacterized protein n=1 Tax=Maudiozyma exigua TaxID=34358 RepID=A0A9P6VZM7_MAUEX|nr:hypothetical protein C6P45_001777 [Kazachstania exigua]